MKDYKYYFEDCFLDENYEIIDDEEEEVNEE